MVSKDRIQARASELDASRIEHVQCETCGLPTPMTGTRRCNRCWEIEHRLAGYLRDGGEVALRRIAKEIAACYRGQTLRDVKSLFFKFMEAVLAYAAQGGA